MPTKDGKYGKAHDAQQFARAGAGTPLVVVLATMFRFTPPPSPQPTPTPCPQCQACEGVAVYATVRTEYFRCIQCQQVWEVRDGGTAAPHLTAA